MSFFNKQFIMCFSILFVLPTLLGSKEGSLVKKEEIKNEEVAKPSCTAAGDLGCPKGFKPFCPSDFQPTCIFVGTRQLPACLDKKNDGGKFEFYLDRIKCEKSKLFGKQ